LANGKQAANEPKVGSVKTDAAAGRHSTESPIADAADARASVRARSKKTAAAGRHSTASTADGFAAFWAIYPKHVGRLDAEKAFAKAIKQTDLETLIAGAKRYAAERAGEPPKFTKNPANWLRAGMWADEPGFPHGGANSAPIIDNATGDLIEPPTPPPRRNGYRREETWDDVVAAVIEEARHDH
jgi:hypothetical protein